MELILILYPNGWTDQEAYSFKQELFSKFDQDIYVILKNSLIIVEPNTEECWDLKSNHYADPKTEGTLKQLLEDVQKIALKKSCDNCNGKNIMGGCWYCNRNHNSAGTHERDDWELKEKENE